MQHIIYKHTECFGGVCIFAMHEKIVFLAIIWLFMWLSKINIACTAIAKNTHSRKLFTRTVQKKDRILKALHTHRHIQKETISFILHFV